MKIRSVGAAFHAKTYQTDSIKVRGKTVPLLQ